MNPSPHLAPFIDGSYGAALVFLVGAAVASWRRYRLAARRLKAAEPR